MLSIQEIEKIIIDVGMSVAPSTMARAIYDAGLNKMKAALEGVDRMQLPKPLWSYEPPSQYIESPAIVTARMIVERLGERQPLDTADEREAYVAALRLLKVQVLEASPPDTQART